MILRTGRDDHSLRRIKKSNLLQFRQRISKLNARKSLSMTSSPLVFRGYPRLRVRPVGVQISFVPNNSEVNVSTRGLQK